MVRRLTWLVPLAMLECVFHVGVHAFACPSFAEEQNSLKAELPVAIPVAKRQKAPNAGSTKGPSPDCQGVGPSAEPVADARGSETKTVPKRVLLLGQRPDTHPHETHEYMAGVRLISRFLQDRGNLQVIMVQADSPWDDGPELLDGAEGVVLFLTEGAKWVSDNDRRLAAFQRLAKRGGGFSGLHWGLGTREAPPVTNFVGLFGGCHGGPDRKFKVGDFRLEPAPGSHPITSGIAPFSVHDEIYYSLKFPKDVAGFTPLVHARGMDVDHTVAWAWERPGTGRSFGFTGLHFHENWNKLEYRRLIVQGVLWTLNEPIPKGGLPLEITHRELALPDENKNDIKQ